MFIKTGQLTYRFGGSIRKLFAGDIVCFWSSIPHQITYAETGNCCEWVSIPLGMFIQWQLPEDFVSKIIQGKMLIFSDSDSWLFKQWEKDLNSNNETARRIVALEVEAKLRRFALSLGLKKKQAASRKRIIPFSTSSLGKIEQINLYIANNYQKKMSVAEIANKVNLHPNYLVSLFRSHCGIGIVDFISQFRISHAQRLLATTDMKILDIAFDSGFSSASNFYIVFKQICQQTPSEYRTLNSPYKL